MPEERGGHKYQVIAAELRAAIQGGGYAPGDRLPGENDLMREHGVARMTARQALAVLVNEGLADPQKGRGVFVRGFRPLIRQGIGRVSSAAWGSGQSVWSADLDGRDLVVDRLEVRREHAPDRVNALLDLGDDPGDVVVRSRRFVLDGKPVLLTAAYIPADIAAGTLIEETETGPGGTYARLADLGYGPARFREDLRARMPDAGEIGELALSPGTPVVDITRTAFTAGGRAVEVSEMTADAGSYILRYEFDS